MGGGISSPGGAPNNDGSGGSGVVLVKEANVLQNTSGKWTIQEVYQFRKDNTWTS